MKLLRIYKGKLEVRRREVGLRLKMISNEERRERKVEIWLDRVRRQREGVEGAVLEADILESLLDEGIDAYSLDSESKSNNTPIISKDKQRSWKGIGILGRKRGISNATSMSDGGEAASITRVLLAEELVDTLVKDLQVETERRMKLEGERVEWLAKEAIEGVEAGEILGNGIGEGGDGVVFDLDQHEEVEALNDDHQDKAGNDVAKSVEEDTKEPIESDSNLSLPLETPSLIPLETPPPLEPTPTLNRLSTIFAPLIESHKPLQSSLNALSHSLTDIRDSLPTKRNLNLLRKTPLQDPVLLSILENLHESLEDARVDVEIAIADEDRVYRGFEALLGVGFGGGVVQSGNVFQDAKGFVEFKLNGIDGWGKLNGKVNDLEMDLSTVKSKIHELEGMDLSYEDEQPPSLSRGNSNSNTDTNPTAPTPKSKSIWNTLDLKTVTLTPTTPVPEDGRRRLGQGMFGGVSSVGRSFSASVISAPRKVGGFAGGLYKPRNKVKLGEEEKLISETEKGDQKEREDDVE